MAKSIVFVLVLLLALGLLPVPRSLYAQSFELTYQRAFDDGDYIVDMNPVISPDGKLVGLTCAHWWDRTCYLVPVDADTMIELWHAQGPIQSMNMYSDNGDTLYVYAVDFLPDSWWNKMSLVRIALSPESELLHIDSNMFTYYATSDDFTEPIAADLHLAGMSADEPEMVVFSCLLNFVCLKDYAWLESVYTRSTAVAYSLDLSQQVMREPMTMLLHSSAPSTRGWFGLQNNYVYQAVSNTSGDEATSSYLGYWPTEGTDTMEVTYQNHSYGSAFVGDFVTTSPGDELIVQTWDGGEMATLFCSAPHLASVL